MTFTAEDVKQIIDRLGEAVRQQVGITNPQEVAGYVLKSVKLLRERIPDNHLLEFVYSNPALPSPFSQFIRGYLDGTITKSEAMERAGKLELAIRQHYFVNRIPFNEDLPDNIFFIPDTPEDVCFGIQSYLERYLADGSAKQVANSIYRKCKHGGTINGDKLLDLLAPYALPSELKQLPLNIGGRDPTPAELDHCYWKAWSSVAEHLGTQVAANREEVIKRYRTKNTHEKDTALYNKSLEGLIIK